LVGFELAIEGDEAWNSDSEVPELDICARLVS
jgi:hypothetical protein